MLRFIREHWIVYLIGLIVAVALGIGASYAVGVIGSTPESVHSQEVAAEQEAASESANETGGSAASDAADDAGSADSASS